MAQPSTFRRAAAAASALAETIVRRSDSKAPDPVATAPIDDARLDGLVSTIAGIGDPKHDRTAGSNRSVRVRPPLSMADCEALYDNAIAGRIVDVPPRECTRLGWSVYVDEVDDIEEGAEPFDAECQRLGLRAALRQRDQWARLYGGAAIILDVDDGLDPIEPINPALVQAVRSLRVVDMHELRVHDFYVAPSELAVVRGANPVPPGKLGEPRIYQLQPHNATSDQLTRIHESRVLIQAGREVPRRRLVEFEYYGASVLQRAVDSVLDLAIADRGIANILEDFRTGVMKVKGLSTIAQSRDGSAKLVSRMQAINLGKSIVRMVLLDGDEDYSQQGVPVSGLADLYGKVQQAVAAASDGMPLDVLFGTAPQGLSSSNDSGREHWHDVIAGLQTRIYEPDIRRVCDLLRHAGSVGVPLDATMKVVFHPLRTPSEKEQAETREIQSRVDERYMKWNVLHPGEVRAGRFTGVGWSGDTRLLEASEREAVSLLNDEPALPPPGE